MNSSKVTVLLTYLFLTKTPCGKYYYCLYFTDKETETSHLQIRELVKWPGIRMVSWTLPQDPSASRAFCVGLCGRHDELSQEPSLLPESTPVF